MASLLSLRAAVTKPVSGVHGSESNLIFAGISSFSSRAAFAACKLQRWLKIKKKVGMQSKAAGPFLLSCSEKKKVL